MIEAGIGRVLVASLHQGIADLLPTRLEFYESWINPAGMRKGRIGLAPVAAVLSFLRQEGPPYQLVSARAGEYAAEWTVAGLSRVSCAMLRAAPPSLRLYLVARVGRWMIRHTYRGSRVTARWQKGRCSVDIRDSIFCGVRDRVDQPLCEFYASALRRLTSLFDLDVDVAVDQCRGTGAGHCVVGLVVRQDRAA